MINTTVIVIIYYYYTITYSNKTPKSPKKKDKCFIRTKKNHSKKEKEKKNKHPFQDFERVFRKNFGKSIRIFRKKLDRFLYFECVFY